MNYRIASLCGAMFLASASPSYAKPPLPPSPAAIPASFDASGATAAAPRDSNVAPKNAFKLLPPREGIYQAAFPAFGPAEDTVTKNYIRHFENDVSGKKLTWAYFSDNWFHGISFPRKAVETIRQSGVVPFIRIMPRSTWEACQDRKYSLDKIIAGKFDVQLHRYAREAAKVNGPMIMEFGTEVNGDWFPWSGSCNGGARRDGYGSPAEADGPERFRDAYRHLIDIFREEGANNITWVLHLNGEGSSPKSWNSHAAYYPGDDYIDWLGISVYGAQVPSELKHGNPGFREIMEVAYQRTAAISPSKPIAVLEFGVIENKGKPQWIHDALQDVLSGRYPRLKAIAWWHSDWQNDDGSWSRMKIDSSRAALAAYRKGIANPAFVSDANIGTYALGAPQYVAAPAAAAEDLR